MSSTPRLSCLYFFWIGDVLHKPCTAVILRSPVAARFRILGHAIVVAAHLGVGNWNSSNQALELDFFWFVVSNIQISPQQKERQKWEINYFLSAHQRPTAIRIPGAITLSSLTKSTAKPWFKTISGHTQVATLHNKIENTKCQKVQKVDVKMIKWYKPGSQATILSPIARKIRAAPDVHLGVHSLLIQVLEKDLQDLQTLS